MSQYSFEKSVHTALWGTESWEISAFASDPSRIRFDSLCPDFPLLFKVIDAKTRLSVQVHPNEETCKVTGGDPKTEMWCALSDGPIYAGLKKGTSAADVEAAVKSGKFEELLVRHEAKFGDVSKAMKATGVIGDNYFRLAGTDGTVGWGARDFVRMTVDDETRVLASFHGVPCIIRRGSVFYAGTQLAAAAEEKEDATLLAKVLDEVLAASSIRPSGLPKGVHIDRLYDAQGEARFTIVINGSKDPYDFPSPGPGWTELFGGRTVSLLQPGQAILYVRK